jgi:hypothetical protein
VTTADRLLAALAALPTEPDEIARVFAELGIKGEREEPDTCPVARYLAAELDSIDISVGLADVSAEECTGADLPEHVQRFIYAFDHGDYPQLLADGAS